MHYVTEAVYAGEFKLWIRFEDHVLRLVDLADHLDGPVFAPLKDIGYFQSFRFNPDIDTVVWPNNADFSPDFLYAVSTVAAEPIGAFGQ
jgi:hypothetical protein